MLLSSLAAHPSHGSLNLHFDLALQHISISTLLMNNWNEALFIAACLEWFFYSKISVPCALICTLAKRSTIILVSRTLFAMYLHCSSSNKFRTPTILFHALCLLYVLSTATVVIDLVSLILQVSNNPICKFIYFLSVVQWHISTLSPQLQIDSLPMLYRLWHAQTVASGGCDFIGQCIIGRINRYTYHNFIHLNLQRSTVVGSCGVKTSVS